MQLIGIDGAKRGYWVIASADATEPTSPVFAPTDDFTDVPRCDKHRGTTAQCRN